jgi:alkylhydroperoxidase/carboxymuconolactone decarboxylase family protein YurZ
MNMDRLPHWKIMERYDPSLLAKVEPWRLQLLESGVLPRKTKELLMTAMCAVVRYPAGLKIHAEAALTQGASDQELFETCAMTLLIGGIPAYRESVLLVDALIEERKHQPQASSR